MQAQYELKVQAIRSKKQKPRLYVYLPAALAEAISLQPGESVRWELLDRRELHLVRERVPVPHARNHART
jgi:antitoxin component of MazEF toxin-antitoxin module